MMYVAQLIRMKEHPVVFATIHLMSKSAEVKLWQLSEGSIWRMEAACMQHINQVNWILEDNQKTFLSVFHWLHV